MSYTTRVSNQSVSTAKWLCVIILSICMYVPATYAQTRYDLTNCYSGTARDLHRSKDLTIVTIESKGISLSNNEDKRLDNASFLSSQVIQIMNGEWKRFGHTKFMDSDGDYFFVEVSGGKDADINFLYGIGKWEGIQGTGNFKTVARAKAIEPGTFQGCVRNTGTFTLPK